MSLGKSLINTSTDIPASRDTSSVTIRSTPLTEETSQAILNDSLTRELAYLDGLNDAIAVLDDTYTDLNDQELRQEHVVNAFLRDRLGCFAAGICAGLIAATVLAGVSAIGLLPLSVLQIVLLAGGLVAIYFYRDPFHVNQDVLGHEAAVRRRLLEMRRDKMEYRVADGIARAQTAGAAVSSNSTAQQTATAVHQTPSEIHAPSHTETSPQPVSHTQAVASAAQEHPAEISGGQTHEPAISRDDTTSVENRIRKRGRKISRMRVPPPAVSKLGRASDDRKTDDATNEQPDMTDLLPVKG